VIIPAVAGPLDGRADCFQHLDLVQAGAWATSDRLSHSNHCGVAPYCFRVTEPAELYRWWRYPSSRGASFAVKRSELDAALDLTPARSLREVVLATHAYRDPDKFFWSVGVPMPAGTSDAGFRPLSRATWAGLDGRPAPMTADVSFFSVPPDERAQLRALMCQEGLPLVLGWIRELETGPQTRRDATHRLAVYLNRGQLAHAEHTGWPPT
jgi:hypothetical protein